MYIQYCVTIDLNKTGTSLVVQMKVRFVKPVKHDISSSSSVFTPVLQISKTKILSGKILPDTTGQCKTIDNVKIDVDGTVHPYLRLKLQYSSCADFLNNHCTKSAVITAWSSRRKLILYSMFNDNNIETEQTTCTYTVQQYIIYNVNLKIIGFEFQGSKIIKRRIFSLSHIFGEKHSKPQNFLA